MTDNPDRYCVCMAAESLTEADAERLRRQRAALLRAAKWNTGDVISISFLGGSERLLTEVRKYAEEWLLGNQLRLSFSWQESGETDIRVAFEEGKGSWSYLGTFCRQIEQGQPTMNFGWLDDTSSPGEIKRVVLHEFGHALGLIHEHQNPEGGIDWNEPAVIADLSGPPNHWDIQTIRDNVLSHYDPSTVSATNLDADSIMMYPIPNSWTNGDFSTDLNNDLSALDKQLIRSEYG